MTDLTLADRLKTALVQVDQATTMTQQQMESLGNQLGTLYQAADAAGDESAKQSIMIAWEQAQALNANAVNTNGQAVAMAQIATEAMLERDAVQDEYNKLDDALTEAENKGHSSHPRIGLVMNALRDTISEEIFEDGLHLDCPGCEACDGGWMELIDHDFVNLICYALFSPNTEAIVQSEFAQSFADAINAAGDLMQRYYDSTREAAHVDLEAEPEE